MTRTSQLRFGTAGSGEGVSSRDMLPSRPRILALVSYYEPGFRAGGPIGSVRNLVAALSEEFDFRIITRDRDLGDDEPFPTVRRDEWVAGSHCQVFYASPEMLRWDRLNSLIAETGHDLLFLNSLFDVALSIRPLLARRLGLVPRQNLLVAPRGELARAALAIRPFRKHLYLQLARALGILNDAVWLASSEYEAEDIAGSALVRAPEIRVATDLPLPLAQAADIGMTTKGVSEPLRVLFLSRISPMKNLDFAIRALSGVTRPVRFSIRGPVEDEEYWRSCQQLMAGLPGHVHASYDGYVVPRDVPEVMANHDLLFLPTRGENFGHVVFEALAVGTPVLLSDRTLWQEGPAHSCTVVSLAAGEGAFARFLDYFAALSEHERSGARAASASYAREYVARSNSLGASRDALLRALGKLEN